MESHAQQLLDEVISLLDRGATRELRRALRQADPADIADVVEMLDDEHRQTVLGLLESKPAGEVISELEDAAREEVVDDLPDGRLEQLVITMPPDDAADVVEELEPDEQQGLLDSLPPDQSEAISELLTHEPDTAGGLMTPVFVSVYDDATVREAIDQLRDLSEEEEIYTVFVTDRRGRLCGRVPWRQLVLAPRSAAIRDVLEPVDHVVTTDTDQEEVINVIRRYDIVALPVVDAAGRLVGRITHDDVADAIVEEAEEDIYAMAGTVPEDADSRSTFRVARMRTTWLLPCLLGTLVSASVICGFKIHLPAEVFAVLVLFIPMLTAMAGNTGLQTSTVAVRGFAEGSLAYRRLGPSLLRELRVAVLIGLVCGALAGLISRSVIWVLHNHWQPQAAVSAWMVATAVGAAMVIAIMTAAGLGVLLPFMFRRLGIDPAIASGPLITTANDAVTAAIYLTLASGLLQWSG